MEASRELDALIATHIMGYYSISEWNKKYGEDLKDTANGLFVNPSEKDPFWSEVLPSYSTDISAAWQVVEKLSEVNKIVNLYGIKTRWYNCDFWDADLSTPLELGSTEVMATDAPLAICLAALKTMGIDEKELK